MKSQDCVILLRIVDLGEAPWLGKDLAGSLGLSAAEISMSLERSRFAGLLNDAKQVNVKALLDFLVHGLRVVFPVRPGGIVRGIPTAWSMTPLSEAFPGAAPMVWPSEEGTLRGESIEPLYPSVPKVVAGRVGLHEMLAMADALRIGRARETRMAAESLKERFEAYARLAEH